MNKSELIREIVSMEWEMFQRVNNEGGRADCQNKPDTFRLMRTCQFEGWQEEILNSYRGDLVKAEWTGRNLVAEKYANMMASTAPEEFKRIEPMLPYVPDKVRNLTEQIVSIHKGWMKEHAEQYPGITGKGRPLYTEEDTPWDTSSETYLRGELLTYSAATLTLLLTYTKECAKKGINLVTESDRVLIKAYGYPSLEEAERAQRN